MRGIKSQIDQTFSPTPPSRSAAQKAQIRSSARKTVARESALLIPASTSLKTPRRSGRKSVHRSPPPPTGHQIKAIHEYIRQAREEELLRYEEKLAMREKELEGVVSELLDKEERLIKVAEAWKSANKCGDCNAHMQKPFMLRECGHCFCGPCLRQHFSRTLEAQLATVPLLFFHKSDTYDTYKAPKSQAHLERTLVGLRSAEVDPATIFSYDCTECLIVVRKTPIDLSVARTMLCGATDALDSRLDLFPGHLRSTNESAVHGAEYFDGLFLQDHNPLDYR